MTLDTPYQETDRISPHFAHTIQPVGDGAWRCLTCEPDCECTEHDCRPAPVQTARYQVLTGAMLCAACYTSGHMPDVADPVLNAYYDEARRVRRREERGRR